MPAFGDCYKFTRVLHGLHVFPRLVQVACLRLAHVTSLPPLCSGCFPALGTGCMPRASRLFPHLPRTWYSLHAFPRLLLVPYFRALLLVTRLPARLVSVTIFPRLVPVLSLPAITAYKFSCAWHQKPVFATSCDYLSAFSVLLF